MNPFVWWHEKPEAGRSTYASCTLLNETFDANSCRNTITRPAADGCVVVIHGGNEERANPNVIEQINNEVRDYSWVIFVVIGDEESTFAAESLSHQNSRLWVQNPKPGKTVADRYLICGYPNDCKEMLFNHGARERDLDWFFAGQMNHIRRQQCWAALDGLPNGKRYGSTGFGLGLQHSQYYNLMSRAKIVPCPSGPATPDSFRMAEALEAGAIPVIDGRSPRGYDGFWKMVLGEHPLPMVTKWAEFPEALPGLLENWEANHRAIDYWWRGYKLGMRRDWLRQDLEALGVSSHG